MGNNSSGSGSSSGGLYIGGSAETGGGLSITNEGLNIGPTYSGDKMVTGGLTIDKNGWNAGSTPDYPDYKGQPGLSMGNGQITSGSTLIVGDHAGKPSHTNKVSQPRHEVQKVKPARKNNVTVKKSQTKHVKQIDPSSKVNFSNISQLRLFRASMTRE